MKKIPILLACVGLLGFIGCGGSGGSSATRAATGVTGLEIASQMSLVEAQEVSTSPSVSPTLGLALAGNKSITDDILTPYFTDALNVYVYDNTMESLDIVNEILCSLEQSRYDELVNDGDANGYYLALIDNGLCTRSGSRSSSQGNQSSGANAEDLETWVVHSSRVDNNSDQIVTFWIPEEGDDFQPAKTIAAKMTITEGKSSGNPYGKFHLDFKMVSPAGVNEEFAHGYLETVDRDDGRLEFQFWMNGTDSFNVQEASHVIMDANGAVGEAYASHSFAMGEYSESAAYFVAFNESHYLTQDVSSGTQECLNRAAFDSHVFRYGVYNEDGTRLVVSNPGFGVKFGDEYGWAGYWGIWFDDSVTIESGQQLTRANNDDSSATYTTFVAPGKLVKHTKVSLTLADVEGDYMNLWNDLTGQNIRVYWDGTNLRQHSTESFGDEGARTWTDIPGTPILEVVANNWYNFWRDGIGSLSLVVPNDGILLSATEVVADTQEVMTGSHADFSGGALTLNCFVDCPTANMTSEEFNWEGESSPFVTDAALASTPIVYTIDPADMILKDANGDSVDATSVTVSQGSPNEWGINSGSMVLSSTSIDNVWDVWSQSPNYTWETGPNNWNRFTGLLDSNGTAVAFDPPVQLNYTHTSTGDKYILDYSGFGELHGVPWVEDAGTGRWYPTIQIPDGTEVTSNDGTTYTVRALDMEQSMQTASLSSCSGVTLDTTITVPGSSGYSDPNLSATIPSVIDEQLKVIKGELTGS